MSAALHKNSAVSALPPDMRRGSASPVNDGSLRALSPVRPLAHKPRGQSNCLSKLTLLNEPRWLPGGLVSEHGIENDQQLAHASGQCHLLLFAGAKQTLIEGFDN